MTPFEKQGILLMSNRRILSNEPEINKEIFSMKMDLGRNLRGFCIGSLVILLLIGFAGITQPMGIMNYEIDTTHSMIIFRAKHNGVSYNYGRFNEFTGEIMISADRVIERTVEFEVKAASIDTGNKKRDQHLRSSDFFSAKQFPLITFKSTEVSEKEGKADILEVTGDLELHGVKKSITVDAQITGRAKGKDGESLIGFESTFTIKRSEFGMTYGMASVSDDIQITVSVEAVHK
ncbi:polyisoprenoid-binding protein [Candidatus Poribacteria bacterium]|nr:MAG: polyisoprenoid-binding protein [Candidatus Poribacteria bacterium]